MIKQARALSLAEVQELLSKLKTIEKKLRNWKLLLKNLIK